MKNVNYEFDYIVAIGRFSGLHLAHVRNFEHALTVGKTLIIIIGSANSPRTIKNPFTTQERIEMISSCFTDEQLSRIKFNCIEDRLYQDTEWIKSVQSSVTSIIRDYNVNHPSDVKISIIGHDKDESTWYLNSFPWSVIDMGPYIKNINTDNPVCSTKIRELMFTNHLNYTESQIPSSVFNWLINFCKTSEFKLLQQEYYDDIAYIAEAHKNIASGVWPTNFLTVDSILIQSGHLLLIQRKFTPGKGLWAIPGGFVNASETCLDAALRELKEETKVKVSKKVLLRNIVGEKLFDHPNRSQRGRIKNKNSRTVTMCYCFKLHDDEELPRVAGSDDAIKAKWIPIGEIPNMRDKMFEDHWDMANYFISRV